MALVRVSLKEYYLYLSVEMYWELCHNMNILECY